MNQIALEMYFYMCSPEPIIKWLEEEGVKTKQDILNKLQPLVASNLHSMASLGFKGTNAGGMVNCMKLIFKHFKIEN